jgi:hypothetical protein
MKEMNMMQNELLRHMLATLSYRVTPALQNTPTNFPEFNIGKEVRTPINILRHMSRVLTYAHSMFAPEKYSENYDFPTGSWEWEVDRFYQTLEQLDQVLMDSKPGDMTWEQLLQGPLSDAMTHVGQLTMLRRIADSPLSYENFIKANIQIGELRH